MKGVNAVVRQARRESEAEKCLITESVDKFQEIIENHLVLSPSTNAMVHLAHGFFGKVSCKHQRTQVEVHRTFVESGTFEIERSPFWSIFAVKSHESLIDEMLPHKRASVKTVCSVGKTSWVFLLVVSAKQGNHVRECVVTNLLETLTENQYRPFNERY